MFFSIIIPIKELNDYIKESLPITLALDYQQFEIIILPNDMPQSIPDYLQYEKVRIIPSGKVSPAIKRDLGAEHARGDYLAFLDDDAYPQRDWLRIAERTLKTTQADCIGGPAMTPRDNSLCQQASGLFYETLIGGGGMDYRYRPAPKSFYVDDFPTVNLIVAKSSFQAVGGFDNHYWPGEDTKFCLDLVKKGFKIWYANDLIVWHHRRTLFKPHLKQVGNYGKHRGHFAKIFPETSFRLTYFVPSFFVLGNATLFLLSLFSDFFLRFWLILLGFYFFVAIIDVFKRTKDLRVGCLTVVTIFLSHLTYGYMFIKGFLTKDLKSELR